MVNNISGEGLSQSSKEVKNGSWNLDDLEFCGPVPPHTPYGVSFFLPEWDDLVQLMEENYEVINKVKYGYTRVFIHKFIKQLNKKILNSLGLESPYTCFIFTSSRVIQDCLEYSERHAETPEQLESVKAARSDKYRVFPTPDSPFKEILVDYVIFDKCILPLVLGFWQITGENVSSRFAAHCLRMSSNEDENKDTIKSEAKFSKEMRKIDPSKAGLEYEVYLEECLGASQAIENETFYKETIKTRIATGLAAGETECIPQHSDVYLFPTGMSSIYNTLRLALNSFEPAKSVCFGFPYKDTKKVLSQFGPGCVFYGVGESEDLGQLEKLLEKEKILMLLCEFPSNPLLKSPDLHALRKLADLHGFLLVIDDTLGNFINLQGMLIADIIVTSLTKIFSGFSDLLAGSITLSPRGKFYQTLKAKMAVVCEDYFWCEDAQVLEKNSRTVVERASKANRNAELLAEFLTTQPLGNLISLCVLKF
ncbi:Cystathionine gamma-synthase [Entomophthora muscae]|uniref:Cystathionine gamma-synthase n=1 Tax=Entomophthora muscae TaxID=34485 RepID=A0ACC2TBV1_9FUNG|nr:Cystathionine gamma-synthase [Entomophthora muscae]